jgi:hypothetical protein
MKASTIRVYAAAAAVPAAAVVIAHLAYVWNAHPASGDRQSAAFGHGIGLAAILAAVLSAARVAQWVEGRSTHVWAEVIGVVATIAVLAHLADDWRAGSEAISSVHVLSLHLGLLALAAVTIWIVVRVESGRPDGRPHG